MRYEVREPDSPYYEGKRAYVYDVEGNSYVAVFHRHDDAYPDPKAAAIREARRLNSIFNLRCTLCKKPIRSNEEWWGHMGICSPGVEPNV